MIARLQLFFSVIYLHLPGNLAPLALHYLNLAGFGGKKCFTGDWESSTHPMMGANSMQENMGTAKTVSLKVESHDQDVVWLDERRA